MKTRNHPLRNVAAALILSSLLGSTVPAQDPGGSTSPRPQNPNVNPISVDFSGGSLADLVEVIRGAGQNINILSPPEASQVSAPGLSLKQVTVENALKAIADVCSNEQARVRVSTQWSGMQQPVFTMQVALARQDRAEPGSVATSVDVFSIRSLTESLPGTPEAGRITFAPDTILTAIDTGLNVADPEGNKAQVRYHADSGLLFVRGTWEQNSLIKNIISSMENDLERRRTSAARQPGGATGPRSDR